MEYADISKIAQEAARIATKHAVQGRPVRVSWIPPNSCTSNPYGHFVTEEYRPVGITETQPWN
jgi:hypothetical protein